MAPPLCKLGAADWCHCAADADDMTKGTWACPAFTPLSVVVATFDRLLDSDPLDPDPADPTAVGPRDDITELTITPAPAVAVSSATDYSSTGSDTSIVFKVFGPNWGNFFTGNPDENNFRSFGPSLQIAGSPTLRSNATISMTLDKAKVRAKDGKTQFVGMGLLADGSIKFKTAPFSAGITVPAAEPTPPPTPDPDAGTDGGADGGATDGGADGGATDGGADGGATDGGGDAGVVTDASRPEAGVDAGVPDAAASEGGASDAASDAPVTPPAPPMPGDPVPADMNMGAITIAFNNLVGMNVKSHIKMTVDGAPFTDFNLPEDKDFPMAIVTITPKTMWEAGKTYVITVDADTTDVLGDKLAAPVEPAAFIMAN
jgi:hypothetical protein